MNRIKIYALLLLLMAALAFYLLAGRNWGTVNRSETGFAFEDTAAISKIIITDNEKRTLSLTRKDAATWLVNNGFKARPDAMNTLLGTIKQVRMDKPISNAAYANVAEMFKNPLKTVQIYTDNANQPAHEYYIGGITSDKKGTYMQVKGSSKPYVVVLPGLEGNLVSRYFTIAQEWRDRLMFNLHYAQIAAVKVEYPGHPENSFLLTAAAKDSFTVEPLLASAKITNPKAMLNKPLIMSYLNSFKDLYAEAYENGYPRTDSLMKTQPFCLLSVTDKQGNTKQMEIHYLPVNQRSKKQVDEKGNTLLVDVDRYLAFINQRNDLVMIQQYVFGKLFRRYHDFVVISKL
ncbi:DUF4340 domain-containing protein [Sphingobacteriales bacterium UPWRP_1]|nr:hypothetical protein BVG80_07775 [Sphingobacteriales bacterium TSM_CSM]PSJ73697.1 DUF4340 domain-containing protein [Sphingobacteriales bacterium UPWRP_1]